MGKGDVQQATVRFFTEEGEEEMAKEKKKLPLAAYIAAFAGTGIQS